MYRLVIYIYGISTRKYVMLEKLAHSWVAKYLDISIVSTRKNFNGGNDYGSTSKCDKAVKLNWVLYNDTHFPLVKCD